MKMSIVPAPKPPFRPVQLTIESEEELLTLWYRLNHHHSFSQATAVSALSDKEKILERDVRVKSNLWSLVNRACEELSINPRYY